MDFTGCTNLLEVRGAGNPVTTINFGSDGLPKVWHFCVRDSINLTQNLDLSKFYSLQELFLWNCNQTGAIGSATIPSTDLRDVRIYSNRFGHADFTGQKELYRLFANNNNLTNVVLDGCTNLSEVLLMNNHLSPEAMDAILGIACTNAYGGGRVPQKVYLRNNDGFCPSLDIGWRFYTNLLSRNVDVQCDWPSTNSIPGGPNAITFVTVDTAPNLEITVAGNPTIIWHWGSDGSTNGGTGGSHFFQNGRVTNYVIVEPTSALLSFGEYGPGGGDGLGNISSVTGLANFTNLTTLKLWRDNLADLDISGCSSLRFLHLAENTGTCPSSVVDKWFNDLLAAVPGSVTNQENVFYYPSGTGPGTPTEASAAARATLISNGWHLTPWPQ